MNNWIFCYRKDSASDYTKKTFPSTMQINRNNITTISLYDEYVEIEYTNQKCDRFNFSEWEIKL